MITHQYLQVFILFFLLLIKTFNENLKNQIYRTILLFIFNIINSKM
ncbi:MAG: hypothetical protein RLZZ231_250 [Bacteroidota bacterium]